MQTSPSIWKAPSRIPFRFCVTWPPPALRERAEWTWAFQLLLSRWRRNEPWVLAWPECCLPRDLQSSVFAPRLPMRSESKGNSETEKHFVKGCCAVCFISSFHSCPALQSCSLRAVSMISAVDRQRVRVGESAS